MAKQKSKSIAATKASKKKDRKSGSAVLGVLLTLVILILAVAAGGCYYLFNFDFNGTIMDNVSIAGVPVGGMTRQEAMDAVTAADTYGSTPMVVKVFDTAVEISPEVSQANLNVTAAVWDAYRYGRRGFASQKELDRDKSQYGGISVDLTHYLTLNEDGIRDALSEFGKHYNTTLSQSTYEVTGTAPALTLVVHKGIPEYGLNLETLFADVIQCYRANQMRLETECDMLEPEPIDLAAILEANATAPVDASFHPENFDVIEGINGCTFDIATVQAKIDEAPYGQTLEIPFDQIAPATTGETLRATLFRDVLATHTGNQSSNSNRATNLRLACESINGVVINPGEVFSYNETLGQRTEERGYKTGIAYVAGKSVPSIGGGICQVSSTLYYCTLQADLEIIARENHCYAPGYVPLGMDATVSWGSLDFQFRNNKDYPIRIEAVADGGTTTVTLMGTDTKDYYIKMEYAVTAKYEYETVYEEMSADNKKGYKDGDYITSPTNGYDVVTYRCKYSKANDELISKDFEAKSHFTKRDAVICKIVDSNSTTETTAPGIGNGAVTEENAPGIGNGNVTEEGGELPD